MTDMETAAPAAEAATPVELKSRAVPSAIPAPEPTPEPAKVETPEPVAEVEAEDDGHEGGSTDESATSDGDDAPAGRKNKGVGKRINELTREKYEAQRERDYWKEQAEKARAKPDAQEPAAQTVTEESGEPTLESCNFDVEAFTAKKFEWLRTQERKQEQAQTTLKTLREKEAAFTAQHPDYEEVAKAPHVPVNQAMAEAMLGAENPPAIAYYLGQNLDEAADIARLSPIQAAIAIGRIAERLSAPPPPPPAPPKKPTNAPPPPKTVSGAAPAQVSVDDPEISTAQRIALWKKQAGIRS